MVLKFTTSEFIEQARTVHGSKYKYLSEYLGTDYKVKISCPVHGIFEQTPYHHLRGQGCHQCGYHQNGLDTRRGLDRFIARAHEVHDRKYQYLGPYETTETKTIIVCPIHGMFEQTPHSHLSGRGCPQCANDERSIAYRKDRELFVAQANVVHDSKYIYVGEYVNSKRHIEIKCPQHGIFRQAPIHHLHGHGCPKCGVGANVSRNETAWLDYLGISQDKRQVSLKLGQKKIKVDAFDPDTNTIYEFYGDYWHGNPAKFRSDNMNLTVKKTFGELYQETLDRAQLIVQAGYKVVSIWENDWKHEHNRYLIRP